MTMDECLKKYDKECMKMAMMKHEETFRQQVHELHRLYRVQKLLMRDLRNNEVMRPRVRRCGQVYLFNHQENNALTCLPIASVHSDQRRPVRALNLELPADEYIERAEEYGVLDVELTLALANSWRKREDATFASDSAMSFSPLKLTGHEWGLQQVEDVNIGYQNGFKNQFEEGTGEDRLKQQAPWLFQCPSLRMA